MSRLQASAPVTLLMIVSCVGCALLAPLVALESRVESHVRADHEDHRLPQQQVRIKVCEVFPGSASGNVQPPSFDPLLVQEGGIMSSRTALMMFLACTHRHDSQDSVPLVKGDAAFFAAGGRTALIRLAAFLGTSSQSPPFPSPLANSESTLPELIPPLGVPSVPFPKNNPPTREQIELGRQLFFDPRLSSDGSISCASCHSPQRGFADGEAISRGIGGKQGIRNTPTVINAAFHPYQFWDGRASSLEDQALLPLENPVEMGSNASLIVDRLSQVPGYRDAFRRVFDGPVTRQNLARALASFERTVLAGDSGYDRYAAGDPMALSPRAVDGMKLFEGKAHCRLCHQSHNFSDGVFHNLGVGWDGMRFADEGRSAVTGIVKDRGAFKTPTLRQVAETAPYMHDGSLASLEAVVDFYDRGGKPNPHLDPLIQPLRLTLQEKEAIIEFLRSLSGTVNFYR